MYRVDSPGKINLMGEHTDYALGYVLSMAINLHTIIHAQRDTRFRFYSQAFHETREFGDDLQKTGDWSDHVKAVIWAAREEGHEFGGMKAIIGGDLHVGSGLGSSVSIKAAVLGFLNRAYDLGLLPVEMSLLVKKAENDFLGVPSGVADAFTVVHARKGHAIFLDTDTLNHSYLPFPKDTCLLVIYTGVMRSVGTSYYAERRRVAEETLRFLGVRSSIDVSERELRALPSLYRRLFGYIVRENRRVLEARDAIREGDMESLGRLMTASHWDLARNYDVSSEELDFLVKRAIDMGAYGAKMTGAGFGGSVVALTEKGTAIDLAKGLIGEYLRRFNWEGDYHVVVPSDGVRIEEM